MGYKVLIAGAGQIGSRYLQGMVKFSEPLTIWVYDISPSALAKIKIVWDEACVHERHQLVPIKNLRELPETIDLSDARQEDQQVAVVSGQRFNNDS